MNRAHGYRNNDAQIKDRTGQQQFSQGQQTNYRDTRPPVKFDKCHKMGHYANDCPDGWAGKEPHRHQGHVSKSGYHHVQMEPADASKTVFTALNEL